MCSIIIIIIREFLSFVIYFVKEATFADIESKDESIKTLALWGNMRLPVL